MLERRLNLLQAVSLNMSMMVGIGPFITIPALIATMGGPQSMIGWVWARPWHYAMEWSGASSPRRFPARGAHTAFMTRRTAIPAGRLLKFLFVWQFLFSGPLEIASGAIGLATYLGYFYSTLAQPAWTWNALFPSIPGKVTWGQLAAMGVMVTVTGLAYRRVAVAGRLMVILWLAC